MENVIFTFLRKYQEVITDENNQDISCNKFTIQSRTKHGIFVKSYFISNTGKVWTTKIICKDSLTLPPPYKRYVEIYVPVSIYKSKGEYNKVTLQIGRHPYKGRSYRVDALVLKAYKNNPFNRTRVRHLNGIKTDDSLNNLIWI